jgi:hypothetical protein
LSLALIAAAGSLAPVAAQGIVPCMHEARFGVVGLARLQVARLTVVNLFPADPFLPPDPIHPPDPVVPPGACPIAIGFLNTANQPFVDGTGAPLVVETDLRPGQSASVELSSADAFRGSREQRMPFRATGLFTHSPIPNDGLDPCSRVVPTLEIYDGLTGRSQVLTNPLEIFVFRP